jgi:hypothetical protein
MKPQAAVLTGDLIGSTAASPAMVEAAMATILRTARRIGPTTRFTRYRGDGWQIYLDDPGQGLWAMLLIAAELRAAKGLESRIALGLGSAYGGSADSLTTAGGSAFVASGRALDNLQPPQRLTIAVDTDHVDVLHARLVALIDERVADWSPEQAEAMAYDLAPEDHLAQAQIAARLGVSRQAIAARLKAAGRAQLTGAHEDFFHHFHRDGAKDG